MKPATILFYLGVMFGGLLLFDTAALAAAIVLVALLWLAGRAVEGFMHRHDRIR
jgi:hypothetical protein